MDPCAAVDQLIKLSTATTSVKRDESYARVQKCRVILVVVVVVVVAIVVAAVVVVVVVAVIVIGIIVVAIVVVAVVIIVVFFFKPFVSPFQKKMISNSKKN